MQKSLAGTIFTIIGLIILLLIPLFMTTSIVKMRSNNAKEVVNVIARSWTGKQKITGVFFIAPYTEKVVSHDKNKDKAEELVQKFQYFVPSNLNIIGDIVPAERHRGIYKVPVYTVNLKVKGQFKIPPLSGLSDNLNNIKWLDPFIVVGIEDTRGLNHAIQLRVNNQTIVAKPGTGVHFIPSGFHLPVKIDNFKIDNFKNELVNFDFNFELNGTENLLFIPIGDTTEVNVSSSWPSPSFTGNILPKTHEITDKGFTAEWQTSFLANNITNSLESCISTNSCSNYFNNNSFGVSLYKSVDIYLQTERALKYAIIIMSLTFISFFLFEALKGLPIHPIQYGLVGTALILFYLLLISLSEHISFLSSYILASAGCISLLVFYLTYILRNFKMGLFFGSILALIYSAIYKMLCSEDYALLMGSLLLFGILVLIMFITRNVNWYNLNKNMPRGPENIE